MTRVSSFAPRRLAFCLALTLPLAACGDQASLTQGEDFGAAPKLAEPANTSAADGERRHGGRLAARAASRKPPSGMTVTAFATGLDHPAHPLRAAERRRAGGRNQRAGAARTGQGHQAPGRGIRHGPRRRARRRAPTASRCCATPTATASPRSRRCFSKDLNSPFGMALVGNDFYVANTDAVMRFPYTPGETKITAAGVKLADLPAGPLNHHWTKDLIASPDGTKLYATVGLQQQRRRARHGRGGQPRRGAGDRPRRAARCGCSPPACAIRTGRRGSRRPARCGSWSTSATRSAAIWCRTT